MWCHMQWTFVHCSVFVVSPSYHSFDSALKICLFTQSITSKSSFLKVPFFASFIHSINIPGSDTCYTWPDHFQEKISENTGFFWMYSGASLPIQVIRQHLILKALCLMDWGRDINLKISVLQAVHITLMAGQQVRDENCELFSSV